MGLLKKLLKTTLDVAILPINIAEDAVTFGGILNDKNEPATVKKIKTLKKDCESIGISIEKLSEDL